MPEFDREYCKLIRELDEESNTDSPDLWNKINALPIDYTLYADHLYVQLNTQKGRIALIKNIVESPDYSEAVESIALQAICDKYAELRSDGFLLLSRGLNSKLLKLIRPKLLHKNSQTRLEAARCISAIENENSELFFKGKKKTKGIFKVFGSMLSNSSK